MADDSAAGDFVRSRAAPPLSSTARADQTVGKTRPSLELLLNAQSRDWEQGRRRLVEEYLAGQPAPEATVVLDLVYHEVLLRRHRGEAPALEEYLRRFPPLADALPLLFALHQALQGGNLTATLNHRSQHAAGAPDGAQFPQDLIAGHGRSASTGSWR